MLEGNISDWHRSMLKASMDELPLGVKVQMLGRDQNAINHFFLFLFITMTSIQWVFVFVLYFIVSLQVSQSRGDFRPE